MQTKLLNPPAAKHSLSPAKLLVNILLVAGAFCTPMTTWAFIQGYLSLSDAFFVAAFAVYLISGGTLGQSTPGVILPLFAAAAVFALSGMVTLTLGGFYSSPTVAFKLIFAMIIAPYVIAIIFGSDLKRIELCLAGWLCGAVLSAVVAFASRYGYSVLGLHDPVAEYGLRARGLGYHENSLGYSSALLVPVAAYLWLRSWHLYRSVIMAASIAFLFYGIYASGSRSSLLALMLGGLPWLPLIFRRYWLTVFLLVMGLFLVAVVLYKVGLQLPFGLGESAVSRLFQTTPTALSDTGRKWAIAYSWSEFLKSPLFGVGWEAFRWSHSNVLAILHSGGLLGLLGFLLWILAISMSLLQVLSAQRHYPVPWDRSLPVLIISGLIIWFINGAFQPLLQDRNGYLLIGALFALSTRAALQKLELHSAARARVR